MLVAKELLAMPGVQDCAVVMGTPANLALMRDANLLTDDAKAATPNDLVVAVLAEDEDAAAAALAAVAGLLAARQGRRRGDWRATPAPLAARGRALRTRTPTWPSSRWPAATPRARRGWR